MFVNLFSVVCCWLIGSKCLTINGKNKQNKTKVWFSWGLTYITPPSTLHSEENAMSVVQMASLRERERRYAPQVLEDGLALGSGLEACVQR